MRYTRALGPRYDRTLENAFHHLPLLVTAGVGCTPLELGDVRFPLSLTREGGQAFHIALPVKIVHGVANHKETSPLAVDLHIEDAYLPLAIDNLWPYMGVSFHIFRNHFLVINQGQRLTISFHNLTLNNVFCHTDSTDITDYRLRRIVNLIASMCSLAKVSAFSTTQAR